MIFNVLTLWTLEISKKNRSAAKKGEVAKEGFGWPCKGSSLILYYYRDRVYRISLSRPQGV